MANGFSSWDDAYRQRLNEWNQIESLEEEAGVCAVVKIRLKQRIALTREAFEVR